MTAVWNLTGELGTYSSRTNAPITLTPADMIQQDQKNVLTLAAVGDNSDHAVCKLKSAASGGDQLGFSHLPRPRYNLPSTIPNVIIDPGSFYSTNFAVNREANPTC